MLLLDIVLVVTTFAARLNVDDYDVEPTYPMNYDDDQRLVGGRPTSLPYLVLVEIGRAAACSGALIAHQWVISTAHCVEQAASPFQISIKAGYQEPGEAGGKQKWEQVRSLSRLVPFPAENRLLFDIALLRSQFAFEDTPLVQPVPVCRNWGFPHRGELCLAAGWQMVNTSSGATHYQPRYLLVHVLNYHSCYEFYGVRFHRSMVCATAEEGRSLCLGDGGAPLVCRGLLTAVAKGLVDADPQRDRLLRSPSQLQQVACGGNRTFMAYTAVGRYKRWLGSYVQGMKLDWLARASLPGPSLALHLLSVAARAWLRRQEFAH